MLTLQKLAISIWLLVFLSSFVVSVPMSHVLRVSNGEENSDSDIADQFLREKREITTEPSKNDTKPNISSFTVTSTIKFRYATTVVSNKVANPAEKAKDISFTVTLPDSAFISGFSMQIKDKVYDAYVKEKEEAKKDYQEALDRGESAGHVELSARDSNVFTVSVNVERQSKVTFNLTYEQLLTRTLGLYENIINVNPGQVVKSMRVEVNIDESSNITVLQVPDFKTSNEIDSTDTKNKLASIEQSGKTATIVWSPTIEQQQELSESGAKGQFIVRYDVDRVSNPNQILVNEGYFVHFYAPADLKTLSKHVLFALDISGSMGGRKIEQLREALVQILGDIGEGDYFSLVLFSDSVQLWTLNGTVGEASPTWYYDEVRTTPQPEVEISQRFVIPATRDNIAKAKAFAMTLNETGGTNIIAALRKSIQIAQWGQKEFAKSAKPLIIFLTDGQPNVEMSDTEEIIKAVKKLNVDKYPLFSLAFGQGADYDFLRKLSLSNSGFARNIYVASDTIIQLNNFYKQVASPLLSNVSFEYLPGQIDNETLTKAVFNNLFNGSELVVAGKLADGAKKLDGNLTGQSFDGFFCVVLPPITIDEHVPVNRTKGHLEKLWAYLSIKELLDQDLLNSDENNKNSTYKQKALKLSLEYGFVTPLTSLVVVKPNETSSAAGIQNLQNPESGPYNLNSVPIPMHMSASAMSYSRIAAPHSWNAQSYAMRMPMYHSLSLPRSQHGSPYVQHSLHKISANTLSATSVSNISPVGLRGPGNLQLQYSPIALGVPAPPMAAGKLMAMKRKNAHVAQHIVSYVADYDSVDSFALPGYSGSALKVNDIVLQDPISTPPSIYFSTTAAPITTLPSLDIIAEEESFVYSTTGVNAATDNIDPSDVLLNLTDIIWLKNVTDIKFPSSNNTYSVGQIDLPNTEFQPCMLPKSNNTLGHCRHLAHCVIREVIATFEDFVPYGETCVIDARFVGICCPHKHIPKTETTTTEIAGTTTSPTTTITV